MIVKLIRDDTRGSSLVEFTVTIPLFLSLMFGLVQAGLLLYTQSGLQHGVERAARCASVNYSAIVLNAVATQLNPASPKLITESCFDAAVAPGSVTNTTIQQYAAANSWGAFIPGSSSYIVHSPTTSPADPNAKCGTNRGYVVTVSQQYNLINYIFSVTLTATSCFPINVS